MLFMADSTAARERGADAPSFTLVGGDRVAAERALRSPTQAPDGLDGAGPEHASALLGMGAFKQEAGEYSEAEELFRRALEIGERAFGPESPALVTAITSLASARIMSGNVEGAEPLVIRALAISESGLAEHDSDLTIVLNDLARLCLKQSAHALAEPLLMRMLALKRSKGEDHPEVATVLASLATVRQALGRHEAAEQLWRRVLEIRERTLAPNHFALATALEHLGEACAARGKIGEALQLLQRAQTIRELTLGAGHASLRISRDRIADLQLQAEGFLDAGPFETPAPAPERYRLLSADNAVSTPAPARERVPVAPRKSTARVVEREAPVTARVLERELPLKNEEIAPAPPPPLAAVAPTPMPFAAVPAPSLATAAFPMAGAQEAEPSVNFRDVIMSIRQELEADDEEAAIPSRRAMDFLASIGAALKERQKATVIVVAGVIFLGGLATVSRAWSESARSATSEQASPLAPTRSSAALSAAAVGTSPLVLSDNPANAPATAAAAATPVTSSRLRVADQRSIPTKKAVDTRPERTGISIPNVSSALAANFDSVVMARSGSSRGVADPFIAQPQSEAPSRQRLTFEGDEPVAASVRAQLIGTLPTPRYPSQLRDVHGEVRVRFDVDAAGRPVMSTLSVVNSPNVLLTGAVLKVIPGLRFVPARSGGADSKAIGDVVQLGFQFRPNNN
jgi:tetratricopeptide (TPR) repeat protein